MKPKTKSKILSFTDLIVWQKAHKLVVDIYEVTDGFDIKDKFGLVSQMQRSALSVTSNIAEGFGRQSKRESIQFYIISRGSLTELQNQLIVAKDTKRIDRHTFDRLNSRVVEIYKIMNGLIRSIK